MARLLLFVNGRQRGAGRRIEHRGGSIVHRPIGIWSSSQGSLLGGFYRYVLLVGIAMAVRHLGDTP